ncbi:5-hydroxytryptamine receptor 3A-like [Sinocyclocheilus anshuiensis]|uniref:5-hydroxytryptamine receptor 3A-like n=1 Tax=Sinocyclocheilus anshuiensis TaxID=1608454 RepID=UPI0007B9A2C2|nr:PREDICTED: 5-hydroxytryptamine receptor 3A-like [Sinocyclocheilus anshuiensis]
MPLLLGVSAAENCNHTDYTVAYEALFQQLGLDKNGVQMTHMRPLSWGPVTRVYVDLYVTSIIEVNEKAQSFSTQVKMMTAWSNRNVAWDEEEFCGMETLAVPKEMFWTPDIGIVESIKTESGTKEFPYVQLISYGYTVSSDVLTLTTACKMDLYRFPFDIQSCNLTLQSSAHSVKELTIYTLYGSVWLTLASKQTFQAQGEWELLSINMINYNATFIWGVKNQLIYQITIKRRPLLYLINFMLPIFFFLVLDVTSFFIDANKADKLSFKVTLLLSISVMLLILNDTLPSTADKIPLIGVYCSVIFSLIGISILETILVNFLMVRGAERISVASVETTSAVTARDDSVRDLQSPPDNQREKTSLCWTRVARIIDVTFFILYIITIIVFLWVLGKGILWARRGIGIGGRYHQLSVLAWGKLPSPHGPPRHQGTMMEQRDLPVSGECPVPSQV